MLTYILSETEMISPTTLLLTLKPSDTAKHLVFVPGQYAAISFKQGWRPTAVRCFSIVTSPTDAPRLQFSMRTRGRYTKALTRLKVGQEVHVRGPFGGFVLDETLRDPVVLVAGGIGITPFMSMIRHATARRATEQITLVYSVQNQDDIPFDDELLLLAKQHANIRVLFVVGAGAMDRLPEHMVQSGRISPEILGSVATNPLATDFYICGPPPFMKAAQSMLHTLGVTDQRIFTEAFGQGSMRQTGKERDVPFNIYVMGALSLVVASLGVLLSDFFKSLPPSEIVRQLRAEESQEQAVSSRQKDLDSAISSLPDALSDAPPSPQSVPPAASKAEPSATTTPPTVKQPTVAKPTTPAQSPGQGPTTTVS